jgi:hypothetical protein
MASSFILLRPLQAFSPRDGELPCSLSVTRVDSERLHPQQDLGEEGDLHCGERLVPLHTLPVEAHHQGQRPTAPPSPGIEVFPEGCGTGPQARSQRTSTSFTRFDHSSHRRVRRRRLAEGGQNLALLAFDGARLREGVSDREAGGWAREVELPRRSPARRTASRGSPTPVDAAADQPVRNVTVGVHRQHLVRRLEFDPVGDWSIDASAGCPVCGQASTKVSLLDARLQLLHVLEFEHATMMRARPSTT